MKAVRPVGYTSDNTRAFFLLSLTGGQQELRGIECPEATCHTRVFQYRRCTGAAFAGLGVDQELVTAALNAVLAQHDVDVFTVTVTGDRSQTISFVFPRHQLPAFRIGDMTL